MKTPIFFFFSFLCSIISIVIVIIGINIQYENNCRTILLCDANAIEKERNDKKDYGLCEWGIAYNFSSYKYPWSSKKSSITIHEDKCENEKAISDVPSIIDNPYRKWKSVRIHSDCRCYCSKKHVPNYELPLEINKNCSSDKGFSPSGFTNKNGTDESNSYIMNRSYGYIMGCLPGIIILIGIFHLSSDCKKIFESYVNFSQLLGCLFLFILIPVQKSKGHLHLLDQNVCPIEGKKNEYLCVQYNQAIFASIFFHTFLISRFPIYFFKFLHKKIKRLKKKLKKRIWQKVNRNELKKMHMNINPNDYTDGWHGTDYDSAMDIKVNGFKVSIDGLLGKGVYISRDITKAMEFAKSKLKPTLIKLKVKNGKMINIGEHQNFQKKWHDNFDIAYVPENSMTRREEYCIKDPKMIIIEEIIENPPESLIKEQYEKYRTSHMEIV